LWCMSAGSAAYHGAGVHDRPRLAHTPTACTQLGNTGVPASVAWDAGAPGQILTHTCPGNSRKRVTLVAGLANRPCRGCPASRKTMTQPHIGRNGVLI